MNDCSVGILLVFFFFQAEDVIRVLVRSRGLGDVYKRQGYTVREVAVNTEGHMGQPVPVMRMQASATVSYTHLTLPTSYPV